MNLTHQVLDEVLLIKLEENRLDAESAPGFKSRMVDFINQGHRRVVLDLGQVEFVDSSGLTAPGIDFEDPVP